MSTKPWPRLPHAAAVAFAALATAVAASLATAQEVPTSVRIGWSLAKSGPNAALTDVTIRPNYDMWVKEVNAAGGLMLKAHGKRVPIEVVEYDDRSNTEETVRALERLITQDKVHFVLPPAGTAANIAAAPTFAKHGLPLLGTTVQTERAPELSKRWPNLFFLLGDNRRYADALMNLLEAARKAGRIGDKVAMIHVADAFGVENASAARKQALEHGFKLVVDKSYPPGSQDLSPLLNEIKAQAPDVFIAFSYPPDTVLLSDQARVAGLNTKVFFTGIGTQFPFFRAKYGAGAEGQMGFGGIDGDSPRMKDYLARFKAANGKDAENWASPVTYASLQVLQQAIERVGTLDREAVLKDIRSGSFDTVLGTIRLGNPVLNGATFMIGQWQNGVFQGIAPESKPGAKPPLIPKPAWQ
ncbi:amino acid ABC transporter substrate-binding protein [Aquincola sp. S2]|uniref:Amino acid ABC transporter substrate-binding protein n=1 Tax=Pseudaquabacterium terrae TaxID=2732868 RepID=A0ABX2EGG9_9BURK|nr:amino acid ABC transporter substrate-binding protein [Aquabacterium terrae]NRF67714.1 amino acid ABC transporter substrate-binding protein [Aquabacterium terrae]